MGNAKAGPALRRDIGMGGYAVGGHTAGEHATGGCCDAAGADATKTPSHGGERHFGEPLLDGQAAPPEARESLISRKTVAEVPLTGLSFMNCMPVAPQDDHGLTNSRLRKCRWPRFPSLDRRQAADRHVPRAHSPLS